MSQMIIFNYHKPIWRPPASCDHLYLPHVITCTCLMWSLVPASCDHLYLPHVITCTCLMWSLVPASCDHLYLPHVITCTCLMWSLVPASCDHLYLPHVITCTWQMMVFVIRENGTIWELFINKAYLFAVGDFTIEDHDNTGYAVHGHWLHPL